MSTCSDTFFPHGYISNMRFATLSRDEATSTTTSLPPTSTSEVSLAGNDGEFGDVGSAYDYVADEGDYSYYDAGSNDHPRVTTSETTKTIPMTTTTKTTTTTTTRAASRRTRSTTGSPTTTATYVGDYEDVDSHMARVGQQPNICDGLMDRWRFSFGFYLENYPIQSCLVERGTLCVLRSLHVEILRF